MSAHSFSVRTIVVQTKYEVPDLGYQIDSRLLANWLPRSMFFVLNAACTSVLPMLPAGQKL
jgi:hypothetical protein